MGQIEHLLVGMRKGKWSKRKLIDAVFYLTDSGCKWRQLPDDFPPAFIVHSFYRRALQISDEKFCRRFFYWEKSKKIRF